MTAFQHFLRRMKRISSAIGKGVYINAGVLLMNLEGLRKINFVSKCKGAYEEHLLKKFNDQDLINLTLESDKFILPERFNTFARYSEKQDIVDKKINNLNNSILHFIGDIKPWQSWNLPPFCELLDAIRRASSTKKI